MSRILYEYHLEKETLPNLLDYIGNPKCMYDFSPSNSSLNLTGLDDSMDVDLL